MLMLRKHVVIIGGGWGGITLARKLKKIPKQKLRITLVSSEAHFKYSPAMYRVAVGFREKDTIIPISELVKDIPSLSFKKGRAGHIDRAKRIVHLESGTELHYDYLVISTGAVTNYFNIPGIKEMSYGIKSLRELRSFKAHLHEIITAPRKIEKNIVIIGGGPTGVELSAALGGYINKIMKRHGIKHRNINIELMHAAKRLIPQSSIKSSQLVLSRLRQLGIIVHLNSMVEKATDNSLIYNGKQIATHTVIWTAGTSNNPLFTEHRNHFPVNPQGKVIVDDHLRVDNRCFVIGDNAATPHSGLAYTAVNDAKFVAKELEQRLAGRLMTKPYRPKTPKTAIPVGKRWAVFQYKNHIIYGFPGWLIRLGADLVGFIDIAGIYRGTLMWLGAVRKEEKCSVCKTAISHEDLITQQSYRLG
jgi:NADH dehydrogenase